MASPRDVLHLKNTLFKVEELREELGDMDSSLFGDIHRSLESLKELAKDIDRVLVDEPPVHLKEEAQPEVCSRVLSQEANPLQRGAFYNG